MFSKITFLKSGDQAEKNEICLSFLEEIFTKSVHRGGVTYDGGACPWDYFKESKKVIVCTFYKYLCKLELKEKLDIGNLMFYT